MRSFTRKSTLPLSALVTAIAVASCQAYPPIGSAPTAAQSQARDAQVTADLGPLLARLQARKVLGQGFNEPTITQYRLTARGPGMSAVTSTPVAAPVSDKVPAYHTLGTAPVIQLNVPSGVNRVFVLEGIDAKGHVLASIATLTTLQSGAALSLNFGANTDAAARVLARLLESHQASFPNLAPFFTADQTGPLLAFIDRIIGADGGGGFVVNPLAIDREFIVNKLRAEGTSFFGGTNLPTELTKSVWGRLNLVVTSPDGKTPVKIDSAQVTIFDPVSGAMYGSTADTDTGEVTFSDLPQGTWAVRVSVPGYPEKWETVTVSGTTFARVSPFTKPADAYTLSSVEGGAAVIATSADGSRSLAVWAIDNGEASRVQGIFLDENHQPIGEVMYLRDVDDVYDDGEGNTSRYRYSGAGVAFDPESGDFLVTWLQQTQDYPREAASCKVALNGDTSPTETIESGVAYNPTRFQVTYGPAGKHAVVLSNDYAVYFKEFWDDGEGNTLSSSAYFSNCTDVADPSLAYNPVTQRYVLAWAETDYDPQTPASGTDVSLFSVGDQAMSDQSFGHLDSAGNYGDFSHPKVALSDGTHSTQLIVWQDETAGAIRSALLETAKQGSVGEFQAVAMGDVRTPSVATVPHGASGEGRYLVGWQEGSGEAVSSYRTLGMYGNPRVFVRFLDEAGTPDLKGAIKLSDKDGVTPALSANPSTRSFVALWNTPGFMAQTLYARVMQ